MDSAWEKKVDASRTGLQAGRADRWVLPVQNVRRRRYVNGRWGTLQR